jgi:hypothetical protein
LSRRPGRATSPSRKRVVAESIPVERGSCASVSGREGTAMREPGKIAAILVADLVGADGSRRFGGSRRSGRLN